MQHPGKDNIRTGRLEVQAWMLSRPSAAQTRLACLQGCPCPQAAAAPVRARSAGARLAQAAALVLPGPVPVPHPQGARPHLCRRRPRSRAHLLHARWCGLPEFAAAPLDVPWATAAAVPAAVVACAHDLYWRLSRVLSLLLLGRRPSCYGLGACEAVARQSRALAAPLGGETAALLNQEYLHGSYFETQR